MIVLVPRDEADKIDPRCGKAVEAGKALKLSWHGKSYFFCSEECRRHFEIYTPDPSEAPE